MTESFVGLILGVIIVAAAIYFGRASGIDSRDADNAQDILDAVGKANEIDAKADAMSDADKRDRLRGNKK
jgi:hypothetical protein